jgi:hypothetical protein
MVAESQRNYSKLYDKFKFECLPFSLYPHSISKMLAFQEIYMMISWNESLGSWEITWGGITPSKIRI